MSGIGDAIFGSKSKTSTTDPYRSESDYEKAARLAQTGTATNLYNQGSGYASGAANSLYNLANNYNIDSATQKQAKLINDNTAQGLGSMLNNFAGKGVINSTEATQALKDLGASANNQLLAAYNNNVDRASQLNSTALQAGQGLMSPYSDLYKQWMSLRAATPLTVTQTQGSSGLLGAYMGSEAGAKSIANLFV